MSDIDLTEAVEAAAISWDENRGLGRMRAALTAALPHIERQVREQVAREIESGLPEARRRREDWIQRQQADRVLGYTAAIDAIETCARIARGEKS